MEFEGDDGDDPSINEEYWAEEILSNPRYSALRDFILENQEAESSQGFITLVERDYAELNTAINNGDLDPEELIEKVIEGSETRMDEEGQPGGGQSTLEQLQRQFRGIEQMFGQLNSQASALG